MMAYETLRCFTKSVGYGNVLTRRNEPFATKPDATASGTVRRESSGLLLANLFQVDNKAVKTPQKNI